MKYLISYFKDQTSEIYNRVITCNSIEEAIQDHEDKYGLDYFPIINVFELSNKFTSLIEDDN